MEPLRIVVAYCRVSTLEQKRRGYGIDIQMADVRRFAANVGLVVARFYKDEAQSGIDEQRRALRRLVRDCRAGLVGTVVVPSLDRLSRNVRLAENLFYEFGRLGVRVLIADMPTYNSRDRKDVMLRQIREVIAEENRKDIIERLWKGRRERVRRGLVPGGNISYGYRRSADGIRIDPQEADVVRRIFERAARKASGAQIASELNAAGWLRRNGKAWTQRQVSAVLGRAELYKQGEFHYGDATGADPRLALVAR